MKNTRLYIPLFLLVLVFISYSFVGPKEHTEVQVINSLDRIEKEKLNLERNPDYGNILLYFIPNKGQVHEQAQFYAKTSRYTLWMTKEGLVFDSSRKLESDVKEPKGKEELDSWDMPRKDIQLEEYKRDVSRLIFQNAKENPEIVPLELTEHRVNYFKGNDIDKWKTDISTSKKVLYKDLYKNIDLKVYGVEKQIEYDWIVMPGGNSEEIIFAYKDTDGTEINNEGDLLVFTEFGELIHKKPVSFQVVGGNRVDVESSFKRIGKDTFGFKIGEYDKNYELVIDPVVVLSFSTYLGRDANDYGWGIAVDSTGSAYITGYTLSTDFPTQSPYQTDKGEIDVFVTKLSPTGSSLVYSTYLGGSADEGGFGIAVNSSGNAYVTGRTESTDFPTQSPYQTDQDEVDVFVTKLSPTGASLVYSTYLGGSGYDEGSGIAVDSTGNAYATGHTESTDFPTQNPYQTDLGGTDAFVTKLSPTGSSLVYSTYLGGSDTDSSNGIALDSSGNAYISGTTYSSDFPTKNPYQGSIGGGLFAVDAFVTKLSATGTSLVYSTYLGGSAVDQGRGIAVDSSGNAYVTGHTKSTDFPTQNPYQTDQGETDVFVTKLSSTGTSLVYSTYLGGSSYEAGFDISVDSSGNAYVIGRTDSTNFPTRNTYQSYIGGSDVFVTKLSSPGTSLVYSTYLGGSGYDLGNDIAIDSSDNAYVTGRTESTDFPTQSPYQTDQGGTDAFVMKLSTMKYKLTLSSSNGDTDPEVGIHEYDPGTEVSITVTPDTEYLFSGWTGSVPSGHEDDNPLTIVMDEDKSINANFTIITFAISGNVNLGQNDGGTTVSGGLNSVVMTGFPNNTQTDLSGNYNAIVNYGWSGIVTPIKTGYTFNPIYKVYDTIISNKSGEDYTALLNTYTLTTTSNPLDGGVVSKNPEKDDYIHGENVQLTASSNAGYAFSNWSGDASGTDNPISIGMYNNKTITANFERTPSISLSKSVLNFGATTTTVKTNDQQFCIYNSGGGTLVWAISDDVLWLNCSSQGSIGNAEINVSVNPNGLSTGIHQGKITVFAASADNSPQSINVFLLVFDSGQDSHPFGYFDTPVNGSTISGSVAVTGWALDDIEVKHIEIRRNSDVDDPLAAIGPDGLVHVGYALFVKGSRIDVESLYPDYPLNDRAGWGYMLLTFGLPRSGNGNFKLYAYAEDVGGKRTLLGTKNIVADNDSRTKPFGAIDTPIPGQVISGTAYVNFGWTLTPPGLTNKYISYDGSTLFWSIDSVIMGNVDYGDNRLDIAGAFPECLNANTAGGHKYIDTTMFANGVHTIGWYAVDNEGFADGFGSRFFEIQNVGGTSVEMAIFNRMTLKEDISGQLEISTTENRDIEIEEMELVKLEFDAKEGLKFVGWGNNMSKDLPIGSTLDEENGIFYWMPGPGFLNQHVLNFAVTDGVYISQPFEVIVNIIPKRYKMDRKKEDRKIKRLSVLNLMIQFLFLSII
ncbi:SBBP repeat-containing protein [Acidobacteriota bacterium]